MQYDFDTVINRCGTNCAKWDYAEEVFHVKGILPMWVADMDFRAPEPIIEAIRKVAEQGIFGYYRIGDSYYEALIDWMKRRHDWEIKKEWVVFSPGVVTALHILVRAFTQPGDRVIVQTPVYFPFFNAIKRNDCEILDNPLRLENGQYAMDLADLEQKITAHTKMIILCNPQNPISRVWRREELEALGKLCLKHNILVVSDEIHEDIVYTGYKHVPFPLASEEFGDRCVVCTSASKTFNLPGLHLSNIVIPNADLRKCFSEAMTNCAIPGSNVFGAAATEAAYRYGEPWLEQLLKYLEGNIAFLKEYVRTRIPGVKVIEPQATYLLWLDFRNCCLDKDRLNRFVREEAKVGLQAGTQFGAKEPGFERMNIACPRATLAEGLRRIEAAVASLRKG